MLAISKGHKKKLLTKWKAAFSLSMFYKHVTTAEEGSSLQLNVTLANGASLTPAQFGPVQTGKTNTSVTKPPAKHAEITFTW